MCKPYCEHLEDAKMISDTHSLIKWLQEKAQQYQLKYLLAHAEDGIIWGSFEKDGTLITQTSPEDIFSECKFTKLDLSTLQQCRIFGETAEIMLWKVNPNIKARLVKDDNKPEYIPEYQILWGTHGEKREDKGFTLLRDGQQGLRHAVPFTDIEFENKDKLKYPVRLLVHHYIDYDESGVARIYLSRLVSLTAKEIKND